jgi:ubiquinone/menaquinone biosynthesis C-methylase UbiE
VTDSTSCPVRVSRSAEPTRWLRAHYDRAAASYDKRLRFVDRTLFAGGREWVCAQAHGDVLEIAIGTGLNLPHYPADATLTGIDLSPAMLALAEQRARELERAVTLQLADAQALPFADAGFDTVVSTLSLCTIPDERAAIAEVLRVLRPGGHFLLLEHVRSPHRIVRLGQRAAEQLTLRLEGDHQLREPCEQLKSVGFAIEQIEATRWGIVERVAARKPAML